eukprot:SAG31_NODE_37596_length_303_cov_0.544118_2_plen_37_part_01
MRSQQHNWKKEQFTAQYALYCLWKSLGVDPVVVSGQG